VEHFAVDSYPRKQNLNPDGIYYQQIVVKIYSPNTIVPKRAGQRKEVLCGGNFAHDRATERNRALTSVALSYGLGVVPSGLVAKSIQRSPTPFTKVTESMRTSREPA
jgi:hypothetical protein